MPWCPLAPATGQHPPHCQENPRLLLVSSGPSVLQSPPTLQANLGALRGLSAHGLLEESRSMLSCCAALLWDILVTSAEKKKVNRPHSPSSRSSHMGPCGSGRKEGQGARGEKAASLSWERSSLSFLLFICLCFFFHLLLIWPSRLPHSF